MGQNSNTTAARITRNRGCNKPCRVEIERWVNGKWETKTYFDVKPGETVDIVTGDCESFKVYELED